MSEDTMMKTRTVPENFGPLRGADANARITGPCGDTMEFWLRIDKDRIDMATFTTDGCNHSMACGSAAAGLATGSFLQAAGKISQADVLAAAGDMPEDARHCALLASNTLKAAVTDYQSRHRASSECEREDGNCGACDKEACQSRTSKPTRGEDSAQKKNLLKSRLESIRHKIVVLSGKGGVGKSTVAVNLAMSLSLEGKRVGLLDIDIHGPSVPIMLGLSDSMAKMGETGIAPVSVGSLKVMSIGLLLRNRDDALIWRGPMKMGVIEQFLKDVEWGELDYLIVDCPPGTGDEPLSICQLLDHPDGAVVVTTPQEVAAADVRKSINFCRQLGIPVLGVVENMSGFTCPECKTISRIFNSGGGKRLAEQFRVPFLGQFPIDPAIGAAGDEGVAFVKNYPGSLTARLFETVAASILELDNPGSAFNAKPDVHPVTK